MTTSRRVVFFGNERLVSGLPRSKTPILKGLIERGYDVAAIVANHTDSSSRSRRDLEVASVAAEHNIPLLTPQKPGDIESILLNLHADFAILAAYGKIIPQRIINVFDPVGIINIHPSLLPRHRGPTPIETTILAGDQKAGVSIMRLTAGMDEGPVFGQAEITLTGDETKFDLHDKLAERGAELLFELLPYIIPGKITPESQSSAGITYSSLFTKQDGIIDPTAETADVIVRKVRAYLGFPKTRLTYRAKQIIITKAISVDNCSPSTFCIPCAENSTLRVESLIGPSGKQMSGEAFLRGLR